MTTFKYEMGYVGPRNWVVRRIYPDGNATILRRFYTREEAMDDLQAERRMVFRQALDAKARIRRQQQ